MAEGTTDKFALVRPNLDRFKDRIDINNTLILAIATLAITWCSYQSALWSSIQIFKLADAGSYNRQAQEIALRAGQQRLQDEQITINFVHALLEGRTDKTEFYIKRIRPELASIFSAWQQAGPLEDTTVPVHPMAMSAYLELVNEDMKESNKLRALADRAIEEAQNANKHSDRYSLFTVIFSMVMFLGAIATKASKVRLSFTLILVASIICIVILTVLFFTMPIARE